MAARDSVVGGNPRQMAVSMVNAWRGSLLGAEEEGQAVPESVARAIGIENIPGVEVEGVTSARGEPPRRWRHTATGNSASWGAGSVM